MDTLVHDRGADLKRRWQDLKAAEPGVRARDAAARLGVSEGELVAARCGDGVVRLDGDWGEVLKRLPTLGTVMTITRNEHAVHEKTGRYDKVQVTPGQALVLDREIDLRIFLNRWRFGFAVREAVMSGLRDSLQFFDLDGTAVHKVYLTEDSDRDAYRALVDAFTAADQRPGLATVPSPRLAADRPDDQIDVAGLRAHWERLQDTHDFFALLRDFNVGRHQALRLVGGEFAQAVDPGVFQAALKLAADRKVPIMVFVGNAGCIQIHTGPVERIEPRGPWVNVLDLRFNLHVRGDRIASAWIVRKPTRDGIVTALELFDADNQCFLQMFGERKPGKPELETWRALVGDLPYLETEGRA